MSDQDRFAHALRRFAATMAHSYDRNEVCYEVCEHVTEVLDASGAGVAVASDDELRAVAGSDERIVAMEEVQDRTQQGPCAEAFRTQEPILVDDLRAETRWPEYRSVAERVGLRGVVGFPLALGPSRLGALNVYTESPRSWSQADLAPVAVFADMATAYLVRASELQEASRVAEQLQGALDSRVIIEQAKGMVANELHIDVGRAFDVIRRHARNNGVRLSDLADAIVNMGLRIPGD